ncbi:lytic transglycosylase domain-containing protein [Mumia sp. Pv 4-285]|uniref:aggregation-promoting factor C-terminal-like domain-containing protein n=1 Tax=Mumia qirimensis TaxID=3234852 RepID=UPI00351D4E85
MPSPLMPVRRSAAQDGKRKAARTPVTTRLLTRARTPRGRLAAAGATAAALAIVGGAVVGAAASPESQTAAVVGADVTERSAATAAPSERTTTDVSRSGERAAVGDAEKTETAKTDAARTAAPKSGSVAAAKKQQAAKAEAPRKVITETARMQDRDPRDIAKAMLADFGFGAGEFSCLNDLWVGESNWRWNADNPTSSAYGIPQALPGSKMASAGADWETNPATQIKWGLGYIKDVYGTPCAAQSFKQGNGWY